MAKTIPEVRIKYAWLLSGTASVALNEKWGNGTPLRSYDEYVLIVDKYKRWWSPHNDAILHGICDIFNLEFRQNIIDINVAPWFKPISDPMVIGPAFSTEDALINTITHELLHRLITDNTSTNYEHDFIKDWELLFGDDHSQTTLVHIPVHAGMKKLYVDVINRPDLVNFDIDKVKDYPDYAKAWEYIEAHDYNKILQQLTRS
ncbi:MAG: hypothetical protein ABI716_01805 [Candidatus Saccharibacteria bacterium]